MLAITLLTILGIVLTIVEFFVVAALILVGLDMAIYHVKATRIKLIKPAVKTKNSVTEMLRKEKLRREKEAAAYEGFFEDSYVPGFDSFGGLINRTAKVPTEKARDHYKKMDDLVNSVKDADIFNNTKDL